MAAWVQDMRDRNLADTTINLRLAAVSSFFRFTTEEFTEVDADGIETPAAQLQPRRRQAPAPAGDALRQSWLSFSRTGKAAAGRSGSEQLARPAGLCPVHGVSVHGPAQHRMAHGSG